MNDIRIRLKFALIALAFTIPALTLMLLVLGSQQARVERSNRQLDGLDYIRPARKFFVALAQHRGMANTVLRGDQSFASPLSQKRVELDAILQEWAQVDAKLGGQFKTSEKFNLIKREWEDLSANTLKLLPPVSFFRHTELIKQTLNLVASAANESSLVYDDSRDAFYLTNILVFSGPKHIEMLGQARGFGSGVLAAGGEPAVGDVATLASHRARALDAFGEVQQALVFASQSNPAMGEALTPATSANSVVSQEFFTTVDDQVLKNKAPTLKPSDYFELGTKAINGSLALQAKVTEQLDLILKARIATLQKARTLRLIGVLGVLALAIGLFIMVGNSIIRAVKTMTAAADRISMGELDLTIDVHSHDELGELAERFRRMQTSLKMAMEQLGQ